MMRNEGGFNVSFRRNVIPKFVLSQKDVYCSFFSFFPPFFPVFF